MDGALDGSVISVFDGGSISDHEGCLTFCYQGVIVLLVHGCSHHNEAAFLLDAPTFKIDGGLCRQRVLVAKVAFGGDRFNAAEIQPVGHYIVKRTKNNAAVSDALVSTMQL